MEIVMNEKARTGKESREPLCANERGRKTSLDEERGVAVSVWKSGLSCRPLSRKLSGIVTDFL
ncbi:Uncharacterised protein [Niallia circulans]|nr:Uncharacterised protein [Niallia circulans]